MARTPKNALAHIVKGVEVTIDGSTVFVPSNKEENSVASMVTAAQMRDLIQAQIKKYKDGELQLSPKELRDLAEALATVAKFSGCLLYTSDAADEEDSV